MIYKENNEEYVNIKIPINLLFNHRKEEDEEKKKHNRMT